MSGLIPQPFINELLNQTDLVELVDSYVPLKKQGTSFIACCPFHSEKTPSFNVVAKKQFYHCFGCGASGNAISFIMQYLNQSFVEAVETLAARAGLQVPRDGNPQKPQQSLNLYQVLDKVSEYYQSNLKTNGQPAIEYLLKRGLSGQITKKYQLGFALEGWHHLENHFKKSRHDLITTGMLIQKEDGQTYDRYRQRIMFPIHDRLGRIIGFGGRSISEDQKPKYLNSPETIIFQKSRELYGLHQLLQEQRNPENILIVEGYMDVIALAQHGIPNAVATLGTATSTYHIQLLSKHTQELIFCFDGDAAGRQAAWRALENTLPHLNSGIDAGFIFLPQGHDPDSLVRAEGTDQFKLRLQQAIPLNQFFLDTLCKGIDLHKAAGKSQLFNTVKPYLQKIPEGPAKQVLIDELSRLTHIENHRISHLLLENKPQTTDNTLKTISRSPLRMAVALLLQHPEIYKACQQHIEQNQHFLDETNLLGQLLQRISQSSKPNTAELIEYWRGSDIFESLTKLASWDHQVPEEALNKEFMDIFKFLQKQTLELQINHYLNKSRQEGLSTDEKIELQTLLKKRHETTVKSVL